MAWDVVLLEPVETWFLKLCASDADTAALVEQAIDRLAAAGPTLGRPLVDTLSHSRLQHPGHRSANDLGPRDLKELRPGSRGGSEIRILFVFEPDREAIMLVAGDKAGQWSRWYETAVPIAEARYAEYRSMKEKEAGR